MSLEPVPSHHHAEAADVGFFRIILAGMVVLTLASGTVCLMLIESSGEAIQMAAW